MWRGNSEQVLAAKRWIETSAQPFRPQVCLDGAHGCVCVCLWQGTPAAAPLRISSSPPVLACGALLHLRPSASKTQNRSWNGRRDRPRSQTVLSAVCTHLARRRVEKEKKRGWGVRVGRAAGLTRFSCPSFGFAGRCASRRGRDRGA